MLSVSCSAARPRLIVSVRTLISYQMCSSLILLSDVGLERSDFLEQSVADVLVQFKNKDRAWCGVFPPARGHFGGLSSSWRLPPAQKQV